MKKVLITQSNYIPWKGYFDGINAVDEMIIFDDMQYTKRDWRNRNKIKTKDGILWLTIPVEVKGKYFQAIKDTKISDPGWAKQHWATLVQSYSKAPCFNVYKEVFEEAYANCKTQFISEINYTFITLINKLLDIKTHLRWSSEFTLQEDKTGRLVDLCKNVNGDEYYSGPTARGYIEEDKFEKENIKVYFFNYKDYPAYRQLHGEFTHEVSILDLLFNEGENAKNFMKSFKGELP